MYHEKCFSRLEQGTQKRDASYAEHYALKKFTENGRSLIFTYFENLICKNLQIYNVN